MPDVMEENHEYLRKSDHRAWFKHGKILLLSYVSRFQFSAPTNLIE